MKRFKVRGKILLAFSIVSLASTVAFTGYAYFLERNTIIDGIDRKLRVAALAVPSILPDGFHDRIEGSNSVSAAEHLANMKRLTAFARQAEVSCVYSFVKVDGRMYFSSTSETEEDLRTGTTEPFFKVYDDATPKLLGMFETGETLVEFAQDVYGNWRSVVLVMKSATGRPYLVGADMDVAYVKRRLNRTLELCVAIGLASFLAVFLIGALLSNRITQPIVQLAAYANRMGGTGFKPDEKVEAGLCGMAKRGDDEVGHLAGTFAQMLRQLEKYIGDLRATTAAKERIESELKIAHDIQMSFLHKVFPPFPDRKEFDLYATVEPAKEVGGDLYDFCLLDDERLFFYVGDVSDKGVPAALFMAVTMTLMKRTAQQQGIDPAANLRQVNKDLSEENENLLFVTLCCFILNLKTGQMHYSNAGHNPPVILRADGSAEWLKLPDGLVLGVMPDTPYTTETVSLQPGDTVVLYTDGVTEAMNPAFELYSEDRLLATVKSLPGQDATAQARAIMASVKTHAAGAAPSDDITIMTLNYKGSVSSPEA
jgi:sigma-B regulation protein RsbU (phosphoserine phosphatase)